MILAWSRYGCSGVRRRCWVPQLLAHCLRELNLAWVFLVQPIKSNTWSKLCTEIPPFFCQGSKLLLSKRKDAELPSAYEGDWGPTIHIGPGSGDFDSSDAAFALLPGQIPYGCAVVTAIRAARWPPDVCSGSLKESWAVPALLPDVLSSLDTSLCVIKACLLWCLGGELLWMWPSIHTGVIAYSWKAGMPFR